MYLSDGTRLDIIFVIRQLSKQNAELRVGYLLVAKQVMRYLKSTIH